MSGKFKFRKISNDKKFSFLKVHKQNKKFSKCILCESIGNDDAEDSENVDSYPCFLFDGEMICESCCRFEINCGREDSDFLELIKEKTEFSDEEIYYRCMRCEHSSKRGIYEVVNNAFCFNCKRVKIKDKKDEDDEDLGGDDKKVCILFNTECPYNGNSVNCEHGAWNNATLLFFRTYIERELELRGLPPGMSLEEYVLGSDDWLDDEEDDDE